MENLFSLDGLMSLADAYKAHAAAGAAGYLCALVIPAADLAVLLFRVLLKFPLVKMAVKKNPEALKKAIDAIEQALAHEVDAVAADGQPPAPTPALPAPAKPEAPK